MLPADHHAAPRRLPAMITGARHARQAGGAALRLNPRRGLAAWLAEPAPMGALEFISSEAYFAGGFVMKAEKVGRDTLLARIVQLVAEAQRSRAPMQRLADAVALREIDAH
mgnify:CR=1 FL=1